MSQSPAFVLNVLETPEDPEGYVLWGGAGGRDVSPPGRGGLDLSPLEGEGCWGEDWVSSSLTSLPHPPFWIQQPRAQPL